MKTHFLSVGIGVLVALCSCEKDEKFISEKEEANSEYRSNQNETEKLTLAPDTFIYHDDTRRISENAICSLYVQDAPTIGFTLEEEN